MDIPPILKPPEIPRLENAKRPWKKIILAGIVLFLILVAILIGLSHIFNIANVVSGWDPQIRSPDSTTLGSGSARRDACREPAVAQHWTLNGIGTKYENIDSIIRNHLDRHFNFGPRPDANPGRESDEHQ
jgi:hypothetical protein